ncbi:MAG: fluoride efflux transporter CrcB [Oscillospiraceae bacterium]
MKLTSFLAVAAGGAVGAVLRYLISLIPFRGDLPAATLLTNLIGAVAIGFIAGFAASGRGEKNLILFFKTGVCGGFTTFSTFSLEAFGLLEKGKTLTGAVYIAASLAGCILGVWLGMTLSKYAAGE